MATFGQPSSEHAVPPALRNTMTVTAPGIVSTVDSGPRTRRSCSAHMGVALGLGLTVTRAGRTAAGDAQLLRTATAATPTAVFRATGRRVSRLITPVSGTASAAQAISTRQADRARFCQAPRPGVIGYRTQARRKG